MNTRSQQRAMSSQTGRGSHCAGGVGGTSGGDDGDENNPPGGNTPSCHAAEDAAGQETQDQLSQDDEQMAYNTLQELKGSSKAAIVRQVQRRTHVSQSTFPQFGLGLFASTAHERGTVLTILTHGETFDACPTANALQLRNGAYQTWEDATAPSASSAYNGPAANDGSYGEAQDLVNAVVVEVHTRSSNEPDGVSATLTTLIALRPLRAGEEIFMSYGDDYWRVHNATGAARSLHDELNEAVHVSSQSPLPAGMSSITSSQAEAYFPAQSPNGNTPAGADASSSPTSSSSPVMRAARLRASSADQAAVPGTPASAAAAQHMPATPVSVVGEPQFSMGVGDQQILQEVSSRLEAAHNHGPSRTVSQRRHFFYLMSDREEEAVKLFVQRACDQLKQGECCFLDPVTFTPMSRPMLLIESGHTYDHTTLLQHQKASDSSTRCPITNVVVDVANAVRNFAVEMAFDLWLRTFEAWESALLREYLELGNPFDIVFIDLTDSPSPRAAGGSSAQAPAPALVAPSTTVQDSYNMVQRVTARLMEMGFGPPDVTEDSVYQTLVHHTNPPSDIESDELAMDIFLGVLNARDTQTEAMSGTRARTPSPPGDTHRDRDKRPQQEQSPPERKGTRKRLVTSHPAGNSGTHGSVSAHGRAAAQAPPAFHRSLNADGALVIDSDDEADEAMREAIRRSMQDQNFGRLSCADEANKRGHGNRKDDDDEESEDSSGSDVFATPPKGTRQRDSRGGSDGGGGKQQAPNKNSGKGWGRAVSGAGGTHQWLGSWCPLLDLLQGKGEKDLRDVKRIVRDLANSDEHGGFWMSFINRPVNRGGRHKTFRLTAFCDCSPQNQVQCTFKLNLHCEGTVWTISPPHTEGPVQVTEQGPRPRGTYLFHIGNEPSGLACASLGTRRPSIDQLARQLRARHDATTMANVATQSGAQQQIFVNANVNTVNLPFCINTCKKLVEKWTQSGAGLNAVTEYAVVDELLQDICRQLPGSQCHAQWHPVQYGADGVQDVHYHFVSSFCMLGPVIHFAQVMGVDCVEMDAAWISGSILRGWKQMLVTTEFADAQILPIAMAVCAGETTANWEWFLQSICEGGLDGVLKYREDSPTDLTAMRDGAASIKRAVINTLTVFNSDGTVKSTPLQKECIHHFAARFVLKTPSRHLRKVMCFFYTAASTPHQRVCETMLCEIGKLAPSALKWLEEHPRESWTTYATLEGGRVCTLGHMATSRAESINAAFKQYRLTGSIVELIIGYVRYSVNLLVEVSTVCETKAINDALGGNRFLFGRAFKKQHIASLNARVCVVQERERNRVYCVTTPGFEDELIVRMSSIASGDDRVFEPDAVDHRQDEHLVAGHKAMVGSKALGLEDLMQRMTLHRRDGAGFANLDTETIGTIKHCENADFIVDVEGRKCTCGVWQSTGIPCTHAMAVILYMKRQPEHQEDLRFDCDSHEFACAWFAPRHWAKVVGMLVKGVVNGFTDLRISGLTRNDGHTAPDHSCALALKLQNDLERGQDVSVQQLSRALEQMGIDSPVQASAAGVRGAPGSMQHLVDLMRRGIEDKYCRHRKTRTNRFFTKGMDRQAFHTFNRQLRKFSVLAPLKCSTCGGTQHNKDHCAGSPDSEQYLERLQRLNVRLAKYCINYNPGNLPVDAGSGMQFFPSRAQVDCFGLIERSVKALKVQDALGNPVHATTAFARDLAQAISGRDGAVVREWLPGSVLDRVMNLGAGGTAAYIATAGEAGAGHSDDGSTAADVVPARVAQLCASFQNKSPHVSELGEAFANAPQRHGRIVVNRPLTATRSQPGPYPQAQGLFKILLDELRHGNDVTVQNFLAVPAGFKISYGEGQDINYLAYSATELSAKFMFGFYHNEPEVFHSLQKYLPPDVYETKGGMDCRLQQLDEMAIKAGMLPGFVIRSKVFGEKILNGKARQRPANRGAGTASGVVTDDQAHVTSHHTSPEAPPDLESTNGGLPGVARGGRGRGGGGARGRGRGSRGRGASTSQEPSRNAPVPHAIPAVPVADQLQDSGLAQPYWTSQMWQAYQNNLVSAMHMNLGAHWPSVSQNLLATGLGQHQYWSPHMHMGSGHAQPWPGHAQSQASFGPQFMYLPQQVHNQNTAFQSASGSGSAEGSS